jgi:hypothetical protein
MWRGVLNVAWMEHSGIRGARRREAHGNTSCAERSSTATLPPAPTSPRIPLRSIQATKPQASIDLVLSRFSSPKPDSSHGRKMRIDFPSQHFVTLINQQMRGTRHAGIKTLDGALDIDAAEIARVAKPAFNDGRVLQCPLKRPQGLPGRAGTDIEPGRNRDLVIVDHLILDDGPMG